MKKLGNRAARYCVNECRNTDCSANYKNAKKNGDVVCAQNLAVCAGQKSARDIKDRRGLDVIER